MAAGLTVCPKCGAEVPAQNIALHEARCPGPRAAAPPAKGGQPAEGRSGPGQGSPVTGAQIAEALSWARTRPGEVLEALHERLKDFKGKDYSPANQPGKCIVTKEGTAAVEDAIAFVKALEPMGGVGSSSETGLQLAAEDHVADIGRTGTASHSSSDGTSSADRARRYGGFAAFGECLWYGATIVDARTVVMDLIVDDGVPTRGHRKGVFNPVYDTVGCAHGPHSVFGCMVAIEFAKGWEPNDMFIRARLQSGPVKMSEQAMAKAKASATTQWSLGPCVICNEPIKGGKVAEVPQLGGKLHSECFRCAGCSEQLTGKAFKVQAKAPYCMPCFLERFGEKCAACGEVIGGATMKCALGSFHPECVICATCGKAIGKASFSTSGGAITCQACAGAGAASASKAGRPASRGNSRQSPLASAGAGIAAPKAKARPGSSGAVRRENSPASKIRAGPPGGAGAAARGSSPAGRGAPPAKAQPAAKPKVSMGKAKVTLVGMGADYADLA